MEKQVKVPWKGWEVTRTLGTGSFGSVYEIKKDVLGTVTKAAMKVISVPRDTADLNDLISIGYDKESINVRFLDELKGIANEYNMMNQLKGNANIIYCEDLFYEEKPDGYGYDLYIRMELLEPMIMALPNPASEEQVIKLGLDMCNALSACKKHKIIHRDIKPSNILLSSGGDFKLGDFGVSKTSERTAGGTKTGTYGFMAPEVYNNKPYNASVDIYSLGMVLYWMLNHRCGPFLPLPPTIPMANQIDEAKQRRFSGEAIPEPVNGSKELKAIVLKACAFEPDERFSSPEELATELEKLISGKIHSIQINPSAKEQTESGAVDDERTMGNNWGYTDELTQGTQYGGEEIEEGGTVDGSKSTANTNSSDISKNVNSSDSNNTNIVKTEKNNVSSSSSGFDVTKTVVITQNEAEEGVYKDFDVNGKNLKLHIPPGVIDGGELRFDGYGKIDSETGAKGCLVLKISVKSEEEKQDFWNDANSVYDDDVDYVVISSKTAQNGGKAKTNYGLEVVIPKGVKNGAYINTKWTNGGSHKVCVSIHDMLPWVKYPYRMKKHNLKTLESLPEEVLIYYDNNIKGNVILTPIRWFILSFLVMCLTGIVSIPLNNGDFGNGMTLLRFVILCPLFFCLFNIPFSIVRIIISKTNTKRIKKELGRIIGEKSKITR